MCIENSSIDATCRIKSVWLTLLLMFQFPLLALCQPSIQHTVLDDGVARWYWEQTKTTVPRFFQQIENLFDVVVSGSNELPFGKSIAFLVGVSHYDYLTPQLPSVQNDLVDMRDFLLTKGGFDTVYVASEEVVDRDLIEDYMRNKFGQWLNKQDRLLFYYSGHGSDSAGKVGFMQFAKARPNNFAGSQVLKIKDAGDWSNEIAIDHLLFIFDCCASGLAFASKGTTGEAYDEIIATLSRNGSRIIMTAGTAEEKTYEVINSSGTGNGVFTRAFVNAVQSGLADKRQSGFMTIEDF